MSKPVRFWRNVTLIGVAHVAVLYGLIRWNREGKTANPQSIVWMDAGAGGETASALSAGPIPTPEKSAEPTPEPQPSRVEEPDEDRPMLAAAKSDIELPTPTPTATSTPKLTPTPVAKVTPKPKPKPTPKPTAKPTPKPTVKPKPKPSPKRTVLAKASPRPSPKKEPTPEEKKTDDEESPEEAEKSDIAKAASPEPDVAHNSPAPKKAGVAQTDSGKGGSSGAGGHGAGGSGGQSQFGWYGSILHDRFYSEWVQPTAVASSGGKSSVVVKIRIEHDGRVSSFETIKPSGNSAIDESVAALSKRVTHVDPLPAGLGNGDHYDVKINFELNSEQ